MRATAWLTALVFVAIGTAQQESALPQTAVDSAAALTSQSPAHTARAQTAADRKLDPAARARQEKIPPLAKPAPLRPYNLERPWLKTSRERIAETRRRLRTEVGQVRTETPEVRQAFLPDTAKTPLSSEPPSAPQPDPRAGQTVPEAANAEQTNVANQQGPR